MKKRYTLSFLLLSAFAVFGCGKTEYTVPDVTDVQTEAVTVSAVETEEMIRPAVTEADMGGRTFTIYSEGWSDYDPLAVDDIFVEEENGEPLNDAVYARNLAVDSNLNCKVVHASFPDRSDANKTLIRSVMADDKSYDICLFRAENILSLITGGCLNDLSLFPIDFSQPWWSDSSRSELSVGGISYAITSDMTMNDEKAIFCTYYNKGMIETFDLEDPNTLVKDGKWIYDTMFDMAKTAAADLNGNGKADVEDRYGISHIADTAFGILASIGISFADKDADDFPVFVFDTEENYTKYIHVFEKLYDKNVCYNWHDRRGTDLETDLFTTDCALFCLGGIYYAPSMRSMKTDFGIIPFPKYDVEQTDYLCSASPNFLMLCGVPVTNETFEETAVFMDYYAYLGWKMIRPEFYDVLLGTKIVRDTESVEMLDRIFSSQSIDAGAVFALGGFPYKVCRETVKYKADNIASFTEKNMRTIQHDLNRIKEALGKQDN